MTHGGSDDLVSMNAAQRRRCPAIRKLLAEAATSEVDTGYKIGAVLRSVTERQDACGERLAAAVARIWSEAEVRDGSRRPSAHNELLTWSHGVELAGVPATGRTCPELTPVESWSERRLARQLGVWARDAEEAVDAALRDRVVE